MAGARADAARILAAAKEGKAFDASNAGSAWSHNFLNQKPWHPLNFRNQARVFEAEQEKIATKKRDAIAKVGPPPLTGPCAPQTWASIRKALTLKGGPSGNAVDVGVPRRDHH